MAWTGSTDDVTAPNAARVYDYLNGGRDSYAADRDLADAMEAEAGDGAGVRELARINRRFVLKAAQWSASMLGIGQFIDLGCGLPLKPAVHDAARDGSPEAVVVYVDKDPAVISRAETVCWTGPGLAAVLADVSDPAAVLAAEGVAGLIDFARPACLIFGGTLSAMPAEVAREAVKGYAAVLAPRSCMVISCASYEDKALGERMAGLYSAAGEWHNHGSEDVASFFLAANLRLVRGRAADVRCWPMLDPETPDAAVIGGVGVKD